MFSKIRYTDSGAKPGERKYAGVSTLFCKIREKRKEKEKREREPIANWISYDTTLRIPKLSAPWYIKEQYFDTNIEISY